MKKKKQKIRKDLLAARTIQHRIPHRTRMYANVCSMRRRIRDENDQETEKGIKLRQLNSNCVTLTSEFKTLMIWIIRNF